MSVRLRTAYAVSWRTVWLSTNTNTLGIVTCNKQILVEEQSGIYSKGNGLYYRPIGGTIELGEHSQETLVREFQEELGIEITIKSYIKCIENIFKIEENIGHEITQLYLVEFNDPNLYEEEHFKVIEGNKTTYAKWIPVDDFEHGHKILYPNGLTELLKDIT
ncbi:NUDIX domain-containing protein [Paenibacillus alginolyticus]|uniref:NUDIX hydrolase n=1 Tax=Paenibacillus alginolyticus TaxID=59839 RepID=UPI001FCCBADD|nr:NUDIX domain-containing protein [Paenibacillus alginolyticus]MCY9670653.1 NUDIX domain-containing protein [Paenibacillus alginolyticus]